MRKFTSVLLALVLCAALLCIGAAAAGTDDPIEIDTPEALAEIGKTYPISGDYILTEDIDLGGSETNPWTPIDNFNGTFDGGGHTISGLYINNTAGTYQGLFGYVGAGGMIKDLTVEGTITGGFYTGGIAGGNYGDIIDCVNRCEVTGSNFVGGIAGGNTGNPGEAAVQGCSNYGTITCTSAVGAISGGIVGANTT